MLWHCWLGDRKGIRPAKSWMLVCWWWFDWRFAHLIAPVVTTTSITLSSNKIQNGYFLVAANPGAPGKWRERVIDYRPVTKGGPGGPWTPTAQQSIFSGMLWTDQFINVICEMVLLTSGLNDCRWWFVLMVDTLSIVSFNSVKLVCCKLFFLSRLCLEEVAGIDVIE